MSVGTPILESTTEKRAPSSLEEAGVLVVDEDPAFQLGLKTFLREYVGFGSVFVARNGREALDCLAREPSILVVTLDYRMPELDGLGFLAELQKAPGRALGIVMITGYPSDQLAGEFRAFGDKFLQTEEFLSKPVDFESLEPVMLRTCEATRIRRAELEAEAAAAAAALAEAETPVSLLAGAADLDGEEETKAVLPPLSLFSGETLAAVHQLEESLTTRLEGLDAKMDGLDKRVSALGDRFPSAVGRFFLGVLKLFLAVVLVALVVQTGWFDKGRAWLEQAVERAWTQASALARPGPADAGKVASDLAPPPEEKDTPKPAAPPLPEL